MEKKDFTEWLLWLVKLGFIGELFLHGEISLIEVLPNLQTHFCKLLGYTLYGMEYFNGMIRKLNIIVVVVNFVIMLCHNNTTGCN